MKSLWNGASRTTKVLTSLAALLTAIAALVGFGKLGYDRLFPNHVEYRLLEDLHAGGSSEVFDKALGPPSIVMNTGVSSLPKQNYYLRDGYVVMTVSDSIGRAVIYSVLSCRPDFAPTFTTPSGSSVTLQERPLSQAEVSEDGANAVFLNDGRSLTYVPWITGSSPNQLIESNAAGVSTATRDRGYFVGVNGACADTEVYGLNDIYSGELAKAPSSVLLARRSLGVNFYTETIGLAGSYLDEYGALLISPVNGENQPDSGDGRIGVTPYHFDLPEDSLNRSGTRTF